MSEKRARAEREKERSEEISETRVRVVNGVLRFEVVTRSGETIRVGEEVINTLNGIRIANALSALTDARLIQAIAVQSKSAIVPGVMAPGGRR